MTREPWNGLPLEPEKSGWHWLGNAPKDFFPWFWSADKQCYHDGISLTKGMLVNPVNAIRKGWRYIGPCTIGHDWRSENARIVKFLNQLSEQPDMVIRDADLLQHVAEAIQRLPPPDGATRTPPDLSLLEALVDEWRESIEGWRKAGCDPDALDQKEERLGQHQECLDELLAVIAQMKDGK